MKMTQLATMLGTDEKRASQQAVANFLGISRITLSRSMRGHVKRMSGSTRLFIRLIEVVGATSPDVVRAAAQLDPGTDGLKRIVAIVGSEWRTARLMGFGPHIFREWDEYSEPLSIRRLASFMEWIDVVMPSALDKVKGEV